MLRQTISISENGGIHFFFLIQYYLYMEDIKMSNCNDKIKKELMENLEYYRERSKKYGDDLSMIYEFWLDSKRIELKLEQTINELDNDE
jgi:hypothetical protein